MEKKFNVGDRVRFIRDYDNELVYVDKGDCGTIESVDDSFGIRIVLDSPECVSIFDTDYIETINTTDPKTAFLSDLADVLRKHNAVMDIAFGDKCVGIMITISNEKLLLPISTEIAPASQTWLLGEYSHTLITADNIMDYEKE